MKTWYIRNNDEHLGPYSIDELRMLGVYSDDYVWKEGMPKWTKANLIPEMKDFLICVEQAIFPKEKTEATERELHEFKSMKTLSKINSGFSKLMPKAISSLFKRTG